MNDKFKERFRFPISEKELKRRRDAVASAMKNEGAELLIMQNNNQYLGGYVRYFTDIAAEQAYPLTVLFAVDGDITTIASSSPRNPAPPAFAARGVSTRLGAPYFRSLGHTDIYDAKLIAEHIKSRGYKKVGIVGAALINHVIQETIKEVNPDVILFNATDLVDKIKAVKSPEEIEFIRRSVAMHDKAMNAIRDLIHPGMYEYELRAELNHMMTLDGSEQQLVLMGSCKIGEKIGTMPMLLQNRRLEQGDMLHVMIESNAGGGYYCEVARTYCLGEPTKRMQEIWDFSKNLQHFAAKLLRPGAKPCEIIEKVNGELVKNGYQPEDRLFGHSQGYDLIERPSLMADDMMELSNNMFMVIHPIIETTDGYAFCSDNYLIEDGEAKRMTTLSQELSYFAKV